MSITANGILIIKVQFEEKWGVYPNQAETIKVAKSTETPNEWYYYGDFEVISFDEIFDLIEDTVIINSSANDFNIIFGKTSGIFFISDREGGKGSDDIYQASPLKSERLGT